MKQLTSFMIYIPNQLQNAMFMLLLFSTRLLLKIRNRACYYSSLKAIWTKKSNGLKHSILKLIGYIVLNCILTWPLFAAVTPLTSEKEEQYQKAVLNEINRYRLSKGLNKLVMNKGISREARQHSLDMAEKNMPFGHQDFDKRIAHIKREVPAFGGGAENIACFKLPPKQVVQKWLTSYGHKRNIEGPYHLTGIGIAQDAKGWVYYTQIFVKDPNLNRGG